MHRLGQTVRRVAFGLALVTCCACGGTVPSERWGVEVESIRVTAAGHMLDFRYSVVDSERAAPLFKRSTKPYLLDHKSGKSLVVANTAKTGPLRNSNAPQQGRSYFMLFGNHHQLVTAGDHVTIVMGEFRAEDLVVQ